MSFDTSAYLQRATSRAKSDVANKLVSMLLHEVSRKLCSRLGLYVNAVTYSTAVSQVFGSACCYCGRLLESDRAAVEHLDAMNRFRLGLHVPGNVVVACTMCNREKRRDDSIRELVLAESGWEAFISHNSANCLDSCKSCLYWRKVWPNEQERFSRLENARNLIGHFRSAYKPFLDVAQKARLALLTEVEIIYRDCQGFALSRIKGVVEKVCGPEA